MGIWIALLGMVYGSVMCWINESRKTVLVCWALWAGGFFGLPLVTAAPWAFISLQTALAVALLMRWRMVASGGGSIL